MISTVFAKAKTKTLTGTTGQNQLQIKDKKKKHKHKYSRSSDGLSHEMTYIFESRELILGEKLGAKRLEKSPKSNWGGNDEQQLRCGSFIDLLVRGSHKHLRWYQFT